jgi:hypothetical protein
MLPTTSFFIHSNIFFSKKYYVKAARLQINAYFHENFENEIKFILLCSNQKESFTYYHCHLQFHFLQKNVKYAKKCPYCISNAVEI